MNIKMRYIGIIENSTICLDGLTVITGKNNSGKTTVGKALYSLLDAVSDLQAKYSRDIQSYIRTSLNELLDSTRLTRSFFRHRIRAENNADVIRDHFPALIQFYSYDGFFRGIKDYEAFARAIYEEIKQIKFDIDNEDSEFLNFLLQSYSSHKESKNAADLLDKERLQAVEHLEKLFKDISQDPEQLAFIRESIYQTLCNEFSDQIQPVSGCPTSSTILITSEKGTDFSVEIKDNKIIQGTCIGSSYKKVFLIDDPYVIDDKFRPIVRFLNAEYNESESLLNRDRILDHRSKLSRTIHSNARPSVLEQTVLDASLKTIQDKIGRILPGSIQFSGENEFYINRDGSKLKLVNLATGSKMVSIIKILLDRGEIDDTTMLILDEPETHLHPMWQNRFAEIIVLLVKELKVNVLLTTHSSNFVLAIDAYMRKYGITEQTNFYQTVEHENGFVDYSCVNDRIDSIYSDFLAYLSEVKVLRDQYILGEGA